jgi:hypothetical protein
MLLAVGGINGTLPLPLHIMDHSSIAEMNSYLFMDRTNIKSYATLKCVLNYGFVCYLILSSVGHRQDFSHTT